MTARVRFVLSVGLGLAVVACSESGRSPVASDSGSSAPPTTNAQRELRIEPSTVMVGDAVTFSGTQCPPGSVAGAQFPDTPSSTSTGTGATATPDRSGAWSATVTVADATPLGTTHAAGVCNRASDNSSVFTYDAVPVVVTTWRHLRIQPSRAVAAGTTLTVSSAGGCPHPDAPTVNASVEIGHPPMSDVAEVRAKPGTDGEWSTTVSIPATTPPGNYVMSASCISLRVFLAFYTDTPITITAAR